MIECRTCTAGACSHGAQCPTMIRWYDDPWDGTFWRRCECDAWVEPPRGYAPVIVGYIADYPGDTERSSPRRQPNDRRPRLAAQTDRRDA